MNITDKTKLINKLSSLRPNIDLPIIYNIVNDLETLGALNPLWTEDNNKLNDNELPSSFFMISSLFQGKVQYVQRQGWVGYTDTDGNVRLQAKNNRVLLKKVIKYQRND